MADTKRQWTFEVNPENGVGYVRDPQSAAAEVCVIYGDEERMERASLIAAAPDLLEACKAFMAAPEREHDWTAEEIEALQQMTNAIARAEGRG